MNCPVFRLLPSAALLAALLWPTASRAGETLNIYNWADYISDDAIAAFEKETGIAVNYDNFDSLEVLETKMLTGNTGYDLVFPSGPVMERLIAVGVLAPLDKSQIPNWDKLDPVILEKLAANDPGNRYGAPYQWSTIGIGYDIDAVAARLPGVTLDSWSVLFDPSNAAKLADCGIGILDSPAEVLPIALNYLGHPLDSAEQAEIDQARDLLLAIRKNIRVIRNDVTIDNLATGSLCVQLGYGADVFAAMDRAAENKTGVKLGYFIPKEGTIAFFDSMAIPADAAHKEAALKFIDFVLRPQIMGGMTNFTHGASAVVGARGFVEPDIAANPSIFPPAEVIARLLPDKSVPEEVARLRTRAWTMIRSGQ